MTSALYIDPGAAKPGPAWARFTDGYLAAVGFDYFPSGEGVNRIVVERPEYQGERSQQARTQDLMALSWCGAMAAGFAMGSASRRGPVLSDPSPTEWKGTEPKPVQHARAWDVLTPRERDVVMTACGADTRARIDRAVEKGALKRWKIGGAECYGAWKGHNILDAVSLGLWDSGRLGRREAMRPATMPTRRGFGVLR